MNPFESFAAGIAPEHGLALVAGMLTALWLGTAAARRPTRPLRSAISRRMAVSAATDHRLESTYGAGVVDRWAGVLLGVSAAVHLVLPLHPHHGPVVAAGFLASGAAYAVLAHRALHGRRWRLPAALLVAATLVGYLAVLATGEEADQVGIATALVELTVLGLATVPGPQPVPLARPRRLARFAGAATTMTAVFVVGALVWVASFAAHEAAHEAASTEAGEHHHEHEHAGRAQAGVIMRPLGEEHHTTEAQQQAAAQLAEATRQATARYADLDTALADGYHAPLGMQGTDVHLEHKARKSDGATLDPTRPEMLVYAVDGGRATLLGVVFVMEVAGAPGPQPGGPITRWHAHNLCLTALPPGIGIVSPYGGCPAFSVSATSPEMMHVWVVDNPGGAFAEGVDEKWVRAYHAEHGRPYHGP